MFPYQRIVHISGLLGVTWIEPHLVNINCNRSISTGSGFWISMWVHHCLILYWKIIV